MNQTIFMIHGMWGGAWCWQTYQDFFKNRGYRCVVPTLRLHDIEPQAPPPAGLGTTSLLDYAADLEQDIRRLDAPPILFGHSMGGLLAQILASRGLARALVLLTPAAPAGILALAPSVIKTFRSSLTRWGFWRRPIRLTFAEAAYGILNLLPPAEQHAAYDRFVYESGRAAFEAGFWLLDRKKAARADSSRVTCPALVIGAGRDRITPAPMVRKIAAKYAAVAQYKEFAAHAHWLLAEEGWEEVAEYVADWLHGLQQK